jgi:nitrogen fixation NifU-like protein
MEEEIYKEMILELYRNPLNKKVVLGATHKYKEFNPSCGDEIEIFIKFDENGCISDVGHIGQGCAISQTAVSLLTEEIKGKTREEIQQMTEQNMVNLLQIQISQNRIKCATLGLKTIQKCL